MPALEKPIDIPRTHLDDARVPRLRGTFVGREQELERLRGAFDTAAAGALQIVLLSGEPGIGKTATCRELAEYAEEQGGIGLFGHCYEEGTLSLPYIAFVEALTSYIAAGEAKPRLRAMGPDAAEIARIVPAARTRLGLRAPASGDPAVDRYRLFQAVASVLRSIGESQPLCLVLEDLHDADKGTLDMLAFLSRNMGGARALIVATYRQAAVGPGHPLSTALADIRRGTDLTPVSLGGLGPREVGGLIEAISGHRPLPGLAEAVYARTEGNPLFVHETVRDLLEADRIDGPPGRLRAAARLQGPLPQGIRGVIRERFARLTPSCRALLSTAAVIGREFDLETVRAVGGLPEAGVLEALQEAVDAALIQEFDHVGEPHYRFAHALFRAFAHDELLAARRARVHLQVARSLEGRLQDAVEERAGELCEHYAHSSDRTDLAKAVHYGEIASRHAISVYAYSEAVDLLQKTLDLQHAHDSSDKARRCDLLLAQADAAISAADPARAFAALAEEAFQLAEALDDPARASRACRVAHEALSTHAGAGAWSTPQGKQWAVRSDQFAAAGTVDRVYADWALARVCYAANDLVEDVRLKRKALALAKTLGDAEVLFVAATAFFANQHTPEFENEWMPVIRETMRLPRQRVSTRTLARFLHFGERVCMHEGERVLGEELIRELRALSATTGEQQALLYELAADTRLATMDGRLDAAAASWRDIVEFGERHDMQQWSRIVANTAFWELAPLDWQRFGSLREATSQGWSSSPLSLAMEGRSDEARSALAARAAGLQRWSGLADFSILGLQAAILLGDARACAEMSGHLQPIAHRVGRVLGMARSLLGQPARARAHFERGIAFAEKARHRPEAALTRLELAGLLLSRFPAEASLALEHLEFAVAEFEAMGMKAARDRAIALRGGLAPSAPSFPDRLSQREVEILRLIAGGRTNQEIAAGLVISLRTVERHITNAYHKIGARGRADATAYVIARGL